MKDTPTIKDIPELWKREGKVMAVPTNIKTLLSGNVVEWARIEFKETWDGEASLKTICAFALPLFLGMNMGANSHLGPI